MLVGERLAHALAGRVDGDAAQVARDRGEVHVLEYAEPAPIRREVGDRDRSTVVDTQHLAGGDVTDERRADGLERAGLARDEPGVPLTTEAQRTHAERIADRVERRGREDHERPRATQLRQRARKPLVPRRAALVRDDLRDHLRVARGRKAHALARKLVAEIARVDAIAVVAYRELAQRVGADDHGLRVLDARAAGRRVARVADRRAAAEQAEVGLAEDLTDEAHTAHQSQVAAVGRRDPRGFLAAVLERIEREENEPRGFRRIRGRRIPDADDAAHLPVPRRSLLDGGGVLRPVVERLRADLLPERAVPAPGDRTRRVDLLVAAGAGLLRESVGGAIEVSDDLLEGGQAVVLDDASVPVVCARP